MRKFRLYYQAFAGASVEVEAPDEDEARDKADVEFETPGLCWHCSRLMDLGDWEPVEGEYGISEVEA